MLIVHCANRNYRDMHRLLRHEDQRLSMIFRFGRKIRLSNGVKADGFISNQRHFIGKMKIKCTAALFL